MFQQCVIWVAGDLYRKASNTLSVEAFSEAPRSSFTSMGLLVHSNWGSVVCPVQPKDVHGLVARLRQGRRGRGRSHPVVLSAFVRAVP